MPSAYCSNKTLRTESVRIKEVFLVGVHCQETIPECIYISVSHRTIPEPNHTV